MPDPITAASSAPSGIPLPAPQLSLGGQGQKAAPAEPGGIAVPTPTQPATQAGASTSPPPAAALETAITQVREFVKNLPPEIQFSEDRTSGHVVFKVVNPVTHEVVRQFPPEEILSMARRLKALEKGSAGLLIDQQT